MSSCSEFFTKALSDFGSQARKQQGAHLVDGTRELPLTEKLEIPQAILAMGEHSL